MKPITSGMRFDVVVCVMTFPNPNGELHATRMVIEHETFKHDISFSEVPLEVHLAGLKYGKENVFLQPTRLYTAEDFGFKE